MHMSNNLIVSYDLNSADKDYTSVVEVIKSLGSWASVQKSVWYVDSVFTAKGAFEKIYASMDNNDSLIVINASKNDAHWYGVSDEVSRHLRNFWNK